MHKPPVDSALKEEVDPWQEKTCADAPNPMGQPPMQEGEEAHFASVAEETARTTDSEEQSGVAADAPDPQKKSTDTPQKEGTRSNPKSLRDSTQPWKRWSASQKERWPRTPKWLQPNKDEPGRLLAQTAQHKTESAKTTPLYMKRPVNAHPARVLARARPLRLPDDEIGRGVSCVGWRRCTRGEKISQSR